MIRGEQFKHDAMNTEKLKFLAAFSAFDSLTNGLTKKQP